MQAMKPAKLVKAIGDKARKLETVRLQDYDASGVPPLKGSEAVSCHSSAADYLLHKIPLRALDWKDLIGKNAKVIPRSNNITSLLLAILKGHHDVVETIFKAIRALDAGLGLKGSFFAEFLCRCYHPNFVPLF